MKRHLITSALPYANGHIHLGHCSGAYLPADIYARYRRLKGEETLFVCGSDEHGVAINIAAEKEKTSPKEVVDKYHNANKAAFEKFGMSFDIYSRTSIVEHHEMAREFFADFLQKGYLVERESEQFYDEKARMFLPDRYVEGICPNCGSDKARGDQCDNCGAYYNQTELKEPKSLVSGNAPVLRSTTHWYFRFGEFQQFLEDYLASHEKEWKDNVVQQTRSWLKAGLAERAITRDLDWGVKISGLEGVDDEKAKGKVLYVWFDAVLGYISATKKHFGTSDEWKKWWQDSDTEYVAFIGKDNIVFHTLIFPAMLHGRKDADNDYILPANVPAHEFLNLEGQKFSKSRNWSIDLQDLLNEFPDPSYTDILRYTLAVNFPETKDADFTWKDFQARSNNELAAIFGNFVNRTLTFLHKNYDGKVPELSGRYGSFAKDWNKCVSAGKECDCDVMNDNDKVLLKSLAEGLKAIGENYERYRFRDGLTETMNIARAANKYFNDEEPWKSQKSDPDHAAKTMFVCAQLVYNLAVLFAPVIPGTSSYVQELFGKKARTGAAGEEHEDTWSSLGLLAMESGLSLPFPKILFGRIEDSFVEAQVAKLGDKQNSETQDQADLITIDDFLNVKLKTATVIAAEALPKSKKLLKLQVETGAEKRQIIAGIAEHYTPQEMIGKTIVIVANLQPAKLMGELSQGMLLAAKDAEGKLALVTPEKAVPGGLDVR